MAQDNTPILPFENTETFSSLLFREKGENAEGGIYRHFQGGEYKVLRYALHTESSEELIIYKLNSAADTQIWASPAKRFFSEVEGKPRFKKLKGKENESS